MGDAAPNERIRSNAADALRKCFAAAKCFAGCDLKDDSTPLAKFAIEVEQELFAFAPTMETYRPQLLFLKSNLPNIMSEFSLDNPDFSPKEIAKADEDLLSSKEQKREAARARRKRIREMELKDDTTVLCPKCQLPRHNRLNTNRFDVDDENLGNQFENNYMNVCECPRTSSDSDSEDDDVESPKKGANGSPVSKKRRAEA